MRASCKWSPLTMDTRNRCGASLSGTNRIKRGSMKVEWANGEGSGPPELSLAVRYCRTSARANNSNTALSGLNDPAAWSHPSTVLLCRIEGRAGVARVGGGGRPSLRREDHGRDRRLSRTLRGTKLSNTEILSLSALTAKNGYLRELTNWGYAKTTRAAYETDTFSRRTKRSYEVTYRPRGSSETVKPCDRKKQCHRSVDGAEVERLRLCFRITPKTTTQRVNSLNVYPMYPRRGLGSVGSCEIRTKVGTIIAHVGVTLRGRSIRNTSAIARPSGVERADVYMVGNVIIYLLEETFLSSCHSTSEIRHLAVAYLRVVGMEVKAPGSACRRPVSAA
ncbi:hypothetical protein EVAR_79176_1 [Eumeta japonica]|uniref:Uncharacterized protein n=1 Tax=Eumeta variegata TaxID=151549 RepID=A0A4C1UUC6_EUMVA|nr:hypothetical protein EVAR_79176_1 [Eumeta japonica]